MPQQLVDDNGVTSFVDDNGVTFFVDDEGNFLGDPPTVEVRYVYHLKGSLTG